MSEVAPHRWLLTAGVPVVSVGRPIGTQAAVFTQRLVLPTGPIVFLAHYRKQVFQSQDL